MTYTHTKTEVNWEGVITEADSYTFGSGNEYIVCNNHLCMTFGHNKEEHYALCKHIGIPYNS